MKKKIVALLLTLVMLVGIIPAAVYAAEGDPQVVLTVTPDKTIAVAGDEVSVTVAIESVDPLTSIEFKTAFPAGLSYVDNSGVANADAKATLGLDDFGWTEWSKRGASQGENFVNGFASAPNTVEGAVVLCTFSVKVADDAAEGEYAVELFGLDAFMNDSWDVIDEADVLVDSTAITVVDHICADNLTEVAAVEPDCVNDGNIAYFECDVCGIKYADADATTEVIDTIVPALGHTEGEPVVKNKVDATCDEAGSYDEYIYCAVCREELDKVLGIEIPAAGHVEGEAVKENIVPQTCVADGSYESVVYCSVCNEELSRETVVIPAGDGHTEGAVVVENEVVADCVNAGSYDNVVYCTVCNEELSRETIVVPALGHVEGEAARENEVLGNCITDTTYDEVVYCTVCNEELSRTAKTEAADGHDYKAVVTDPTATQGGYTTYTCSRCGDSYISDLTDKVTGKVVLTVANGTNTILTGIVNSDYSASVSVPKGVMIDTSSITAALTMTDVASLGVAGTKTFEKVIATGVNKNIRFDDYIPTTFTGATVGGMIDGVAYSYDFVGENTDEAFTVYATPDAGVQPAWHALTSHISTANKAADDSYVLVPNPAYIQIGTEKLVFEDGVDSFKLDNLSGETADEIRASVKLLNVEELEDAQIEIFLPAGTVLALSNTEAKLEDDATITIYGYSDSESVNTIMSQLRDCTTSTDIIKTLALFIGDVANAINGQNVTLNIEFDHIPGADWTVLEDATCTEDGLKVKYCIMCGEVAVEEVIPAFGHDYESVVTPADCVNDGYTTYTCTVCGDTYTDDIVPALGHDYEAVVTDATCTEDGYTTYTCTVCGDTYVSDHVEELGHTFEAEVIAPTCTEQGYNLCTCTVCGAEHKTLFVDALGHVEGEAVEENRVEATCTEAGSYDSVVYCTRCGVELSREAVVIPAKDHVAGEAVKENEVAADCVNAGSYDSVVYCTVCGVEISREAVATDALGHKYDAVVTAPTCTEAGFTTYTCSVCGDTYVADETAALGHTAGEWVADAEKAGYYNKFCTVCGVLLETTNITGLEISKEYVKTQYVRKQPAFTLTAIVLPEGTEGLDYTVVWTSSNEKVATVDEDGNVTTHHFGTATITATLYDAAGNQIDTEACVVDVYYTFAQWLIWFFLLGCAWYFV